MRKFKLRDLAACILLIISAPAFSQSADSLKAPFHLGTVVTVTNNGISFIPSFTLGKPAAIFDLSVGRKLTFEPQLRFSLEGKPWSFIFWFRYKLVNLDHFKLSIGGHPALSFKTLDVTFDSVKSNEIVAHRYLAGEIYPSYNFTKNISAGLYIFGSHALESDQIRNSLMLSLRSTFSSISIIKDISLRFSPQFYYLRMGETDGYYFSATATILKKNLPFSISSLINQPIKSDVIGGQKFLWNVSLIYSFNRDVRRTN
ncbi:MAG: hypothetical protein U0T33_03955 [Bacteroidales bacterium]